MQVTVLEGQRPCGTLWAERRGLYTQFRAEVETESVCRLCAVFSGGEAGLGIPAPEQGRMTLRVSVPTARLPEGQLLRGCLRPLEERLWRRFPGGWVGELELPAGQVRGRRYRFPWRPGEPLPWDGLLCFYRYVPEGFLEVELDEAGKPVSFEENRED